MSKKSNKTESKNNSTKAEVKKATKPASNNVASKRYAGSMSEFMDKCLITGGKIEILVSKIKAEAKRQHRDPNKYTTGWLRSHAKFRAAHPLNGVTYTLDATDTDISLRQAK